MRIIKRENALVNEIDVQSAFLEKFGRLWRAVTAFAPGRVNLIGEHVDYNDGLVMPIAIQLGTTVVAAPIDEPVISAYCAPLGTSIELELDGETFRSVDLSAGRFQPLLSQPIPSWSRYLQGVVVELTREGLSVPPAAIYIDGDLPIAAGLSSSASLTSALALAICALAGKSMRAVTVAHTCRRVERNHVGVPCGIMDPFACLLSRENHALLLDCRDESITHVPMPRGLEICVIDSGIARELSRGEYAERRNECAKAIQFIRQRRTGIQSLRDIPIDELAEIAGVLPMPFKSRVLHVVSEIGRTKAAVNALRDNDLTQFGKLLNASHFSLSEDYAVSLPQIDQLVELVRAQPGVFGARLTGAGFGGCIIAAIQPGAGSAIEAAVREGYDSKFNVRSTMHQVYASRPACVL